MPPTLTNLLWAKRVLTVKWQHDKNLRFLFLVLGPGLDSILPYIYKYKNKSTSQSKKRTIKIFILKEKQVLLLENNNIKGCVHYIFTSLFLSLKGSTCEIRKSLFYFSSRALFVLKKIKVHNFRYSNFMTLSNAKT